MRSIVHGRWLRLWVLATVALLLLLAGWRAYRLVEAVRSAQRHATDVVALGRRLQANPGDVEVLASLGPSTEGLAVSLERLQSEVAPLEPLLALSRPLPEVGWIADAPDLLRLAVPASQMGSVIAGSLSKPPSEPCKDQLCRVLTAAVDLGVREADLIDQLDRAQVAMDRLKGRDLRGPLQQAGAPLARARELMPKFRQALRLLPAAGLALGMQGPRTYLLLGQNNAELRATGGFIGSFGAVTVDRGTLSEFDYGSSYNADQGAAVPPPPDPLARYMGLGGWYLRDANWWPDFPASAAQVEEAWRRAGHGRVDGVIAFDTTAVEALLQAVGPLELPGYGQVAAGNFEQVAAQQLYSRAALATANSFHQARGAFLGAVGKALVDRITSMPPAQLLSIAPRLEPLLDEKHLLLAIKEPRLLEFVNSSGWDGAIPPIQGDSLLVVDTTVSYGDSYSFVSVRDSLSINLAEDGSNSHDLVLDYYNNYPRGLPPWVPPEMVGGDSFDPYTGKLIRTPGFWGNWLRVYIPSEARSISVDGLLDPTPPQQQFGRTVVAGYLPLAPGQSRQVRLRYTTGAGKEEWIGGHHLYLQKQAGVPCRPISVAATLPGGRSASFQGCPMRDGWIGLSGN